MKKNKLFTMGTLAVMLAFGLVLAGCGDGGEADTWDTVSGFDQLTGTWNGGYNIASKKLTDLMGLMGGLMEDLDDPDVMKNINSMIQDVKVSIDVDMTIRIENDAAKKTATITTAKTTMTFSGDDTNVKTILDMIGALLAPNPSTPIPIPELPEGIDPRIDGKKLIIAVTNLPLPGLSDTDNKETVAILKENFEINQNGKKIKVKIPKNMPEGLLPEDLILTKQ